MREQITTSINHNLCNGCGLCVAVCPAQTLSMQNKKAVVSGTHSMSCGHCEAVCPKGAIKVDALDQDMTFSTILSNDQWLPYGKFDTANLVRLMRSRRSCRNYSEKPVNKKILEDLIKIGATAPSGTNSQCWTFTILAERKEILILGEHIALYFKRLNRLAEKWYLRFFTRLIGNNTLDRYYEKYYQTTRKSLNEWEQNGIDRLFHGASALILIGSGSDASTPIEDSMLAAQNILLASHAIGLGSCLIGFAVEAIKRAPKIKQLLSIPQKEDIHAAIALGYPEEKYQRTAKRFKVTPRYPEL